MCDSPDGPQGRAKRQKIDKNGRFAALEKLKNLKGAKNKCNVKEIRNVYDEVDEREYSKRVLERQDDDWIVDDGGGEYVEDGREIFDDDVDEDSVTAESAKRKRGKLPKKVLPLNKKQGGNIRNMLANMPSKRRTTNQTSQVDPDALLEDIMGEIDSGTSVKKLNTISSKDYIRSLNSTKPSVSEIRPVSIVRKLPKKIDFSKSDVDTINEPKAIPVDECEINDADSAQNNCDSSVNTTSEVIEFENTPTFTDYDAVEMMDDDFIPDDINIEENLKNGDDNVNPLQRDLCLSDKWYEQDFDKVCSQNVEVNVQIDTSSLPLVTNEEGESVFRFFWWDAYEDPLKQPGTVYLFGKVFIESAKAYASCCVTVKNIPRRIFLLPREKKMDLTTNTEKDELVTPIDVYKEFNEKIANANKIMNFKSRKVTRKYAFDLADVPAESEYLEVKYPATHPRLPADLRGETFSRVFGTSTNALEVLLLERRLKGPCWLDVRMPRPPAPPSVSWAKVEVTCQQPEDLVVAATTAERPCPPLTVLVVNIRTVANAKHVQNEVVMVSCLVHRAYAIDKPAPQPAFQQHFCALTKPSDMTWPSDIKHMINTYKGTQLHQHESERSLLGFFLTKLFVIDPDLVVGHDFYGFTLDTLIHRIEQLKVPNWSRVGRLKRSVIPQLKGKSQDKNILCGRLVCDVNISAKELIRARSYDLDTLAKQILNVQENKRQDFTIEEIKGMYSQSAGIITLINATMRDSSYILMLMYELNVIPLALQITNIAGNIMSRTLLGGRSERNEFLLLHAFTEKEFIVPDKTYTKKISAEDELTGKSSKKKPEYAGGLVLDPKKGFYDKYILLMDFNSLYPSIIQEYNICFTTVTRSTSDDAEPEVPAQGLPMGILPIEIRKLVESRRQVKTLMKASDLSSELKMQYNIRQIALKLTANSMYGCLGFAYSRFYAKPLAALVTSRGREILMNTKDIVQRMNFDVIYGDTDSIMINTNCIDYDQVFSIGNKIKQEVNKMYKHVELEVDGVFKYMLLLKKKKYAAVVLSKKPDGTIIATQEYKGLDIVRRDWSQLSAEVGRYVLQQILSDLSPDERLARIRDHLEKVAADLRAGTVPIGLLAITKQLAKNPDDYPDKKSLPHLQVAMRLNAKGTGKKLKAGDTVSYVICDDGSNAPAVQRAYHVDEVSKGGRNETGEQSANQLLIDVNYYITQQLHPVVARLCEPVDGADGAFIADCLGLDSAAYRRSSRVHRTAADISDDECDGPGEYTLIDDRDSFRNCDKFSFTCANDSCKTTIIMDGPLHDNYPVLSKCRNPACKTAPVEYLSCIQNTLQIAVRSYVKKLYENWLICEDPACSNRTRRVPLQFLNAFPVCSLCKNAVMYREYRNADLYYQLKFFKHIFTLRSTKMVMSQRVETAYKALSDQMDELLNICGYRIIDFSKIFHFARLEGKGKNKLSRSQQVLSDSQKKWNILCTEK